MTEPGSSPDLDTVTREIIDIVGTEVGSSTGLTAETNLQSQGLDSLKVMSLMFKIEARYDIVLKEEDGDDIRTVGDLASLVARRVQERP